MSTLKAAGVALRPGIVCMSPQSATSQPAPVLVLLVRVRRETVHGDDRLEPELSHDPEVSREVGPAGFDLRQSAARVAPVVLERLHGRDEDDCVRAQATHPADDVEELL